MFWMSSVFPDSVNMLYWVRINEWGQLLGWYQTYNLGPNSLHIVAPQLVVWNNDPNINYDDRKCDQIYSLAKLTRHSFARKPLGWDEWGSDNYPTGRVGCPCSRRRNKNIHNPECLSIVYDPSSLQTAGPWHQLHESQSDCDLIKSH